MGHLLDEFYDYLETTSDAGCRLANWYVDVFLLISCLWTGLIPLAEKVWRTVSR